MLRLLFRVSLREARRRRGRLALLLGAVATGVALIVAVGVINTSVLASFRRTFESVAGPADLELLLGNGEVAFDEEVVDAVRRDPDVVAAVPFVHGTVAVADDTADTLQVFGAELTAEDDLARYGVQLATDRRAALAVMEDPNGILVSETVAERLGVGVGAPIRLMTARGVDTFTVRGLLAPQGLAAALGGQLVVMDLAAAQSRLAKEGRVDQIDLTLAAGTDIAVVQRRLADRLPSGFSIMPPSARGDRYADILHGLQSTLAGMSLMCMVAGLFVIHNGISASVVHRLPVIATLRMLGAQGNTLVRLLLTETLILAIVGSLAGALIGVALARVLLTLVGETLGTMVQMRFIVPAVTVDAHDLLFAAILGIVTATLAAWTPARRARDADPLVLAKGGDAERAPRVAVWSMLWAVLVVVAVGAVIAGARARSSALTTAGAFTWYISTGVIGVPVVVAASTGVRRLLTTLYGIEGRIAAASVTRVPARAGMTVAAIAFVFAIAVTIAAVIESYVVAAREFVSDLHDGDLVVSAVATEGGWLETPVGEELSTAVARVPGVARIEAARVVPGQHYGRGRVGILALEPAALARLSRRMWRAGDLDGARAAVAAGAGVLVSTVFANIYGTKVGDRLDLEAPTGTFALPVLGTIADMSSSSGTIVMSRTLYAARWHDPTASRLNVYLAAGVDVEEARRRIVDAVGDRYRLKIDALREALAYIDRKIRDAFGFSRSLQLLIVIVAVAGIFDLLFARIFERRRELAVWRVVGASDHAVQRSVIAESLALGVLASVLGLPLGIVTAWLWVQHIIPSLVGYDIALLIPVFSCLMTVAVVLAATVLAGRAAAVSATRASILDGLRDD